MENFKYLLLLGGNGCLGSAIVKVFKNNSTSWKIIIIDYAENNDADHNIILDKNDKYDEVFITNIYRKIELYSKNIHSIINVAGGWVSGSIKNIEIFEQSYSMLNENYFSSLLGIIYSFIIIAGHLATRYITENGLLIFTGAAKVFKDNTPGKYLLKKILRYISLSNFKNSYSYVSFIFERFS
jgi:hypothetical protein